MLPPTDFPDWGMRSAYLRDPDGHLIELCGEMPAESGLRICARVNDQWKERQE